MKGSFQSPKSGDFGLRCYANINKFLPKSTLTINQKKKIISIIRDTEVI